MLPVTTPIPRRQALRQLAVLSLCALAPASVIACSKKTTCTDVTGLTTDEINNRDNIAAYVDQSADPARKCALCAQYVPGAPNACGSCKVVKGPIHPDGTCKLFVAKPV